MIVECKDLTESEKATALRNSIVWAIEYTYRIEDSIQHDFLSMASRDVAQLRSIVDDIRELIKLDEV
jgi:hypothetical protein